MVEMTYEAVKFYKEITYVHQMSDTTTTYIFVRTCLIPVQFGPRSCIADERRSSKTISQDVRPFKIESKHELNWKIRLF